MFIPVINDLGALIDLSIFKSFDNKANYIIEIENGASEDNGEYWNAPTTSFSFVQIGSADSEKDLVYSGLSDLEREWWSI